MMAPAQARRATDCLQTVGWCTRPDASNACRHLAFHFVPTFVHGPKDKVQFTRRQSVYRRWRMAGAPTPQTRQIPLACAFYTKQRQGNRASFKIARDFKWSIIYLPNCAGRGTRNDYQADPLSGPLPGNGWALCPALPVRQDSKRPYCEKILPKNFINTAGN